MYKRQVVRSKNITEQDEVDAMAKAINDAIDALVFQLKIKYGSNGGTGTMANPTVELDKEFTFPKCEYVAPNEKHFKGWQVDNTVYKVGDKRVFTKDDQNKEIKAVWEEHTFDQKLKEVNGVSTLKDKATCTTNAISVSYTHLQEMVKTSSIKVDFDQSQVQSVITLSTCTSAGSESGKRNVVHAILQRKGIDPVKEKMEN